MSMMLAKERMNRVLGISSTGFPILPIRGAEGDENEGNGSTDGSKEGEGGNSGGTGDGGQVTEQPKVVSLEEHERILARMQAADKAKGEFEKKLREIEDKDKSEVEKLKRDYEEALAKLKKAEQEALSAKLSNEILKFPGFVWHDPEAVLRLVDMDAIEVDAETGAVKGVKDALTKLAKDKPYLLKGKQGDEKKKDNAGSNGPSGHNPGGGGDTVDKNKRRTELSAKYKLR
jgi:hypothetical protein